MILGIDIGNSNIVIGCFDREQIRLVERIATDRKATALEYAVLIKTVLELDGLTSRDFTGAIISSVVPPVTGRMKAALERLIGKTPLIVGPGVKTGLKLRLDNAAQVGSDRVVDAVAATSLYPLPLIIIDMGTATTISVVDADKNFIGGLILPGLMISTEALTAKAAQLPQISLEAPGKAIGRSTVACMRSGIVYGCASAIDGLIRHIEEELGESCTVVATGGLSKVVIPHCKRKIALDDELLLKGLMMVYYKNAE